MRKSYFYFRRVCWLAILLALGILPSGCTWLKSLTQAESDTAVSDWSQNMSSGIREAPKKKEAKPSGMLYDERSKQIEKNLGGGY